MTLSVSGVVLPPSHGTAVVAGAAIVYTPAAGYLGSDSFTYSVTDGVVNSGSATVTVSVYGRIRVRSYAAHDGWVLESTERSGRGGSLNAKATTIRIGDDKLDRQFRGILSFDTSAVPDDAVITAATLSFKRQGVVGRDPFRPTAAWSATSSVARSRVRRRCSLPTSRPRRTCGRASVRSPSHPGLVQRASRRGRAQVRQHQGAHPDPAAVHEGRQRRSRRGLSVDLQRRRRGDATPDAGNSIRGAVARLGQKSVQPLLAFLQGDHEFPGFLGLFLAMARLSSGDASATAPTPAAGEANSSL